MAKKKKLIEPISDSVKRLRFLMDAEHPICCGAEMQMAYLSADTNPATDEQIEAMGEEKYAAYLEENIILAPCWSCDVCEKELPIEGLVWPEWKDRKEKEHSKYCPKCGQTLPTNQPLGVG